MSSEKQSPAQLPRTRTFEPGVNDLATLFPHIAAEIISISPSRLFAYSTQAHDWRCARCQRTWTASPRTRTIVYKPEQGCPPCAQRLALRRRQQRQTLADVYPDLAQELLDPSEAHQLSYSSHTTTTWVCTHNHHTYALTVNQRVNGRSCPYCNLRKLLPGFNDLATMFPHLAAQLVNPSLGKTIRANSRERLQWQHTTEDGIVHQWEASVKSRTMEQRGCLVCAGKVIQLGVNDFQSFLSTTPYRWCNTNTLQPTALTKGSSKHVTLLCPLHEPINTMHGAAKNFTNGSIRCQDCVPTRERFISKPEREIVAYIHQHFPSLHVEQHVRRFHQHGIYELDIFVEGEIAIDFHGSYWHQEGVFKPVGYHDAKRDAVQRLGFQFLEIFEDDWRLDSAKELTRVYDMLQDYQDTIS